MEVMDQDFSIRQQTIELRIRIRSHWIDGDATLAGIEVKKEATLLRIALSTRSKRTTAAKQIPRRILDFDYIGAKIGHQLGGERGRNSFAALHHPKTAQNSAIARITAEARFVHSRDLPRKSTN